MKKILNFLTTSLSSDDLAIENYVIFFVFVLIYHIINFDKIFFF